MEKLASYLKTHKAADLAKAVGVSDAFISDLRHGKRTPSLQVAFAIERETGGDVPVKAWDELNSMLRGTPPRG